MIFIGIEIGAKKCAVTLGSVSKENIKILYKCNIHLTREYPVHGMLEALVADVKECIEVASTNYDKKVMGIGISCCGPVDSKNGIILSPPNLPFWEHVEIRSFIETRTGLKTWLCNDANACALAEWKYGAGKDASNMIFITFNTGLGAGLILNNQLFIGANDMAGEIGHIRLADYGPVGGGKAGSFEGFCSSGGIVSLVKAKAMEKLQMGESPSICPDMESLAEINADTVRIAADENDEIVLEVLKTVGYQLGKGLSMMVDLLNPEKVVIGGIFIKFYDKIWPYTKEMLQKESLFRSLRQCQVVPASFSGSVGNIAALLVGQYNWMTENE